MHIPQVVKVGAKALLAFAIAFVGSLATGASDGALSLAEWLVAGSSGLVSLGVVWGVPNAARPARRRRSD